MSASPTTRSLRERLLDERLWKIGTRVVLVIAAIVLLLFPLSPSASAQNTVILALVLAIGAVGLNIITGYAGYLSLSQGAFLGIGAYIAAVMTRVAPDVSPFVWMPLSAASALRSSRWSWRS